MRYVTQTHNNNNNNNNTHASAETRCLVRFVGSCVCCYATGGASVYVSMCVCLCHAVLSLSWIVEV